MVADKKDLQFRLGVESMSARQLTRDALSPAPFQCHNVTEKRQAGVWYCVDCLESGDKLSLHIQVHKTSFHEAEVDPGG